MYCYTQSTIVHWRNKEERCHLHWCARLSLLRDLEGGARNERRMSWLMMRQSTGHDSHQFYLKVIPVKHDHLVRCLYIVDVP